MMYAIAFSVIAGALGLYYLLFKNLNVFKKHNIPYMQPLPIVGNMGSMILRKQCFADILKNIYDLHHEAKYTGIFEYSLPTILLRDPELIKSITLQQFNIFPNHHNFISKDQDPLIGKNLFGLNDKRWRAVRGILSPAFTSSKVKSMFKLMSDYAAEFANFIAQLPPDQSVIEAKDTFTRYTNDVITACAFGINVDSMRDPKNLFYVYGNEAANFNTVFFLKMQVIRMLPWLAALLRLKLFPKEVEKFFCDFVETIIKIRNEKGIFRRDMLQLMMENRRKKEGWKELTIEDITSQAFLFFLGGFDPTSRLMCFAMYEIAVNEDVRKRLQNEIDQVLEDTNGEAAYEAINSMEYLGAVINEALRMYPISVRTDRVCIKDFVLPPTLPGAKPFIVKKGGVVMIPIFGLHHDPKYFKKPEKFDPERFLGEQKKAILNTRAYLPFGLGPRMCIASRFVLLETKVLLFHMLARCDLLPCEKTPMPLKLAKKGLIMEPEGGFWLKTVPRKKIHRSVTVKTANGTRELETISKMRIENNRRQSLARKSQHAAA
ncbi:PREDICTED: cytochrome P450 9e2-like [Dinoponera quadriceps]|uniref:Cytochrome P450 9e2-like n=1 Tax=Dinoponera quadriceps TaxID=609295 RepID=A0A6P3XEB0_DINQU|nr:PREDICTED: cytochrome P450 9e2-like [Dinoponera quadriceps]